MIRLDPASRRRLERLACIAYPREACGVLLGRRDAFEDTWVEEVTEGSNLADASDRFELDPAALVGADRDARERGLELLGVWHSHPDRPAVPSRADLEGVWSGWIQVLASVDDGTVASVRAFRCRDGVAVEEELG